MQKSRYLILGKEEVSKYVLKVNINIILNKQFRIRVYVCIYYLNIISSYIQP